MAVEPPSTSVDPTSEDAVRRLRRAVRELSVLNDIASEIGASLDSEHITNTIIRRSLRAVRGEQGVITLIDKPGETEARTLVRTMRSKGSGQALHIEESLVGWMLLNKRPLLINDPRGDDRFRGVRWDETIRSFLCVPLLVKSELAGILTVFNKTGADEFNEDDQRLLSIVAAQSAQVIENARLYEQEEALRRMREEFRLASEIQLGLLPKEAPVLPGYDIAGASSPAEAVGGDYFDFMRVRTGGLALCLADVSGKGLSAALLMANLQATIRAQTLARLAPKKCLEYSNALLCQSTDTHKFATCFYGVLDTGCHTIHYANAGHDPPFVVPDGAPPARLDTGGLVLGFLEDLTYEESSVIMNPGDALVIYSDGVTDAVNHDDEPFGEERLRRLLDERRDETAERTVESIFDAVRSHAGDCDQADDITVVMVRRERE